MEKKVTYTLSNGTEIEFNGDKVMIIDEHREHFIEVQHWEEFKHALDVIDGEIKTWEKLC